MGPGWEDRHLVKAWVPDAVPPWMWGAVSTFFDVRRWNKLPHTGGTLDQDARLMAAFRVLGSCMQEIERGERMAAAARAKNG